MNDNLQKLKDIERELVSQLQKLPVFIQLESLRKTIAAFETNSANGQIFTEKSNDTSDLPKSENLNIPTTYDTKNLTWKEKVLFVVNKLKKSGYSEIVSELEKLEPTKDHEFLYKRTGVMLGLLKKDNTIDITKEDGSRARYYVK